MIILISFIRVTENNQWKQAHFFDRCSSFPYDSIPNNYLSCFCIYWKKNPEKQTNEWVCGHLFYYATFSFIDYIREHMPYAFASSTGSGEVCIKNLNWLLSSFMIVSIKSFVFISLK